ncbi:histidine kinase [Cryomorpha ignava]|uniref:Histidine kinase n=1 Tax=Cryomorpha ignava TaxID=101383 RepID=A0A7K3WM08_9FLAO|nr:histidine kinase [Cryomorpha ignava]NEN22686.1 histidine kinase [Cryomorpha ignava]
MKQVYSYRRFARFLLTNVLLALVICLYFSPGFEATTIWIKTFLLDYFLYSFLVAALLSGGINLLIEFSGRQFSWLEAPFKRLVLDLTLVVTYSFVVSFILSTIFALFVWKYLTIDSMNWGGLVRSTRLPILIALGFTFFFTSRAFFFEWRQAAIESEKMKTERLAGQYQSLKDQLNPHFLFNSLNVLSNLVYEDADKSNAFIEKLSGIYRYVLDVQDERIVSLNDELKFAKNYLELQKIRFGDKLRYEIEVDTSVNLLIPPLSLQLLLENAVKHNTATAKSPLLIEVVKSDNRLMVRNNLQKRDFPGEVSGIGLNNITERYRFFTDEEVEISEKDGYFSVSIPLLNSE